MMQSKHIMAWISLCNLAVAFLAVAESSEQDLILVEPIIKEGSAQLRVLGFGMITKAADSSRNPDIRKMALPDYTAALQFRPDFKVDVQRFSLSLQIFPELDLGCLLHRQHPAGKNRLQPAKILLKPRL